MAKRKAASRTARSARKAGKQAAKPARKRATPARKGARTAKSAVRRKTAAKKTATRKTASRKTATSRSKARSSGSKRPTARSTAGRRKTAARSVPKAARTAVRKTVRKTVRTTVGKTARRAAPRTAGAAAPRRKNTGAAPPPKKTRFQAASTLVPRKAPALDRARRTIDEDERVQSPPSSLDLDRSASAVRTGRREMKERYDLHTETSPALTGGDVDADWESAYSVGDEAPGGDNPTPDQDIVDEIGRAVGVQYEDNEELKGEAKIAERDRNRWELDPASAEDYPDHDGD